MIDYTLRECPFCGNPAEVIYAEPYDWNPGSPTKKIRCSNKYCIGCLFQRGDGSMCVSFVTLFDFFEDF